MARREALHQILVSMLGSNYVYFQPPESLKLHYPCIIYELSDDSVIHADDDKYLRKKRYTVTVIDKNPDSIIPDEIIKLRYCNFDRFFISDNLNHFAFTLYY